MGKSPSFSEFERMARQGNLIPVYQEFPADIETPVSAYLKIRNNSYSYLLESAEGGNRWGRYSFIGFNPFLSIVAREKDVEIQEDDKRELIKDIGNPLRVIKDLCRKYTPVTIRELPPFQGGLVGYVNYDMIRKWERLPAIRPDKTGIPDAIFTACGGIIIFDHFTHRMKVIALARTDDKTDLKKAYALACADIDRTVERLNAHISDISSKDTCVVSRLQSDFTKEEFESAVKKAKDYIVAGDVIQVVLSQRFSGNIDGQDFSIYRRLRSVNPSPYMFYLDLGDIRFIGASPEILVRLTDGKIELRPIAGTRPRGATDEEDLALERALLADPKERAEHIMLVDLGRNDAGKVAVPGSVHVPRLMEVERYSHVMHIVSWVEGLLRQDMDCFDLFMSAFPAGTVSGAPKIRAMEIISELEHGQRRPYAGAVGYFGFNGNMDFCITIRTITIFKNTISIQAGAGIVADSVPEEEYRETLRKARAMFKAIEEVKRDDPFDR